MSVYKLSHSLTRTISILNDDPRLLSQNYRKM